ncbi:MAG: inositol monophosphatase [Sedimentisphaerales bacterium]|nr:inositol monophosphatase [Sedimentisphaerales bacterium]
MLLEQKDLHRILEVAIAAARRAGVQALKDINLSKVSIKNNNELVTQTDPLCQKMIIDHVKKNFPDHGFIAEEGADGKLFRQSPRGDEKIWWVIDPIDGTNNFVHHILAFSVSIGVMFEGRPIVGVVFDPCTGSTFTACEGGQAHYNTTRMTVNNDPIDDFTSIAIDSNLQGAMPPGVLQMMLRTRFRNMGSSALHLSYVAKGGLVGAVIVCPKLWDIAAGAILVEEAGGIITDWDGRKLFPFDLETYDGKPIKTLAANQKVHSEMVQLLKT